MAEAVQLFFAVISLALGAAALRGSNRAWRLQSHPIDYAMRILAPLWMLYLLICMVQMLAINAWPVAAPLPATIESVLYIALLGGVAFFLLTAAGAARLWVLFVIGLQVLDGVMLAIWSNFTEAVSPFVFWSWTSLNLISAAAVTSSVVGQVRRTNSWRSWLALAACLMGLGLWLHQVVVPSATASALPAVFHLYVFFIFVIWKLISLNPDADQALASAATPFSATTAFQSLNSVNTQDGFLALALRAERQRISYELHDNIGSQIVSVLFTMQASEQPQKRFVMMSLEQCLADLKMTVDALDSFDENVTQAMGRLRYRVQPALDRQGTQMHWDIEMSSAMDAIAGVYAQQVLRIAQESISNVMRHAKASSVKVSCGFVPESGHLVLEVCDDGIGVGVLTGEGKRPAGRGVKSMKRRAAAVGGRLNISNHHGAGTCVRLTLPLPHVNPPPESTDRSQTVPMAGAM